MKMNNSLLKVCAAFALFTSAVQADKIKKGKKAKDLAVGSAVEVCFVLDTTGSMSGMIEGAKRKIWSIANEISASDPEPRSIRFGLVGYRDRGDTYITKKTALTDDLDLVHTELMGFQANGGGDGPESVNQALNEAVTSFQWSEKKGVNRIVFLVGDAPPHMDYKDDVSYMTTGKIAQRKGITINTILCGGDTKTMSHWKKICHLTQGAFAQIEQDGGTQVVAAPQDKKIKELTLKLNETVYLYGDKKMRSRGVSKLKAVEAASPEASASRAAYQTKKFEGKVISGNEDLVDEWHKGRVMLDEVKKDQLPKELRQLSKKQLKEELEAAVAKREEIQKELNTFNKERSVYLSEAAKKVPPSTKEAAFDKAIESMLKKQIK